MARKSARKNHGLVCQHLENLSRAVLAEYQDLIREYVRGRVGVYALYRRGKLYYVGLASNLRNRLKAHLKDKHAASWDRFSVYLTADERHLRELESLILRIVRPRGNTQVGKFTSSENLRARLQRDVWNHLRRRTWEMFGRKPRLGKSSIRRGRRKETDNKPPLAGVFPRTARLRKRYKGHLYQARLRRDGRIRYEGALYSSPSLAAQAIRKRPTNGWTFWEVERSPGEWVRLSDLRT